MLLLKTKFILQTHEIDGVIITIIIRKLLLLLLPWVETGFVYLLKVTVQTSNGLKCSSFYSAVTAFKYR